MPNTLSFEEMTNREVFSQPTVALAPKCSPIIYWAPMEALNTGFLPTSVLVRGLDMPWIETVWRSAVPFKKDNPREPTSSTSEFP